MNLLCMILGHKWKRWNRRFTSWLYRYSLERYRRVFNMQDFKKPLPIVSDHALLRYLDRIKGVDTLGAYKELWTPEVKAKIHEYGGTGKFVINGVLYTVIKGHVKTVAKPNPGQAVISGLNKKSDIAREWSF